MVNSTTNAGDLPGASHDSANSSISGTLFNDKDSDSIRDAGEGGLANVRVELLDFLGKVIAVTTTKADGTYEFTNLKAGDYKVHMPDWAEGRSIVERAGQEKANGNSVVLQAQNTPDEDVADKVAPSLSIAHKPQNLLINGDFEKNPLNNSSWVNAAQAKVEGWSSSTGTIHVQETNHGSGNANGDAIIELNYYTPELFQSVTLAAAGTFNLSLLHSSRITNGGDLEVLVDGVVVATVNPKTGSFQELSVELNLSAGTHEIRLRGYEAGEGSYGVTVDDISLTAIETGATQDPTDSFAVIAGDVLSGKATPGDVVVVLDASGNPVGHVAADASGSYSIKDLAAGEYSLRFTDGSAADNVINAAIVADIPLTDVWSLVEQYEGRNAANVAFIDRGEVNLLINGDFEKNPLNNSSWVNTAQSKVEGWSSSTGTIHVQETNHGSGNANGDAIIELNYYTPELFQSVTLAAAGTFNLSLLHSTRISNGGDLEVLVDGVVVATVVPKLGSFQELSVELNLSAGTHEIRLRGYEAGEGSYGVTVDDVSLTAIEGFVDQDPTDSFKMGASDVFFGTATPGDVVVVLDASGNPVEHVVANESGAYSIKDLAAGEYSLRLANGSAADSVINAAVAADISLTSVWPLVEQYEGRDATDIAFVDRSNTNLLVNGDFEKNPLSNSSWVSAAQAKVEGWSSSTGTIHVQESNYGSKNAVGDAIVELNHTTPELFQSVTLAAAGTFNLSLLHSSRAANGGDLEVLVDGVVVATVIPKLGSFQELSVELNLSAGTHEIRLRGYEAGEGQLGVTVDDVSLTVVDALVVADLTKTFTIVSGNEIAGATESGGLVILENADGKPVAHVFADDKGNYSFEGQASGSYSLRVPTGEIADNLLEAVAKNGGSLVAAYAALEKLTPAQLATAVLNVGTGNNLIVNGEFEDNSFGETGYMDLTTDKLPGWTSNTGKLEIHESNYGIGNTVGDALLELNSVGYVASQAVNIADDGFFVLSGSYSTRSHPVTQSFSVLVDGQKVGTYTAAYNKFQDFSIEIPLTAGAHKITFEATKTSWVGLDNISLRESIVDITAENDPITIDSVDANDIAGVNQKVAAGSVVEVIDESGAVVAATNTAADGSYGFDNLANGTYNLRFEDDLGYNGEVSSDGVEVRLGENQQISDVNAGFEGRVVEACENETEVVDLDSICRIITEDVWFAHEEDICARVGQVKFGETGAISFANAGANTLPFYVFLEEPAERDMVFVVALTTDPSKVQPAGGKPLAPDWFAWLTDKTSETGAVHQEFLELTIKAGQTKSNAGYVGIEQAPVNYTFGIEVVDIKNANLDEDCAKPAIVATTPIAFDLSGDGIINVTGETTSQDKTGVDEINATVIFDIDGDGKEESIEWLTGSGDGLLIDNRDGLSLTALAADMDGNRLFGDQNGQYTNGYVKLAGQFDTNGDRVITGGELAGLQIWRDDGDAKLETGELFELSDFGIVSVDTKVTLEYDAEGRPLARSTAVTDYEETGQVSYSLEGPDAALFNIDEDGKVTFKEAPDFENPLDEDGNNVYEVVVVRTLANGLDPDCVPEKEALRIEVCDKDDAVVASLGDYVWLDTDRDGVQDANEQGVAGVAVTLTGAGADGDFDTSDDITKTTTTDENGKYLFSNLTPGDYKVTFDKPEGYEFTTTDGGAADTNGSDSDANRTTGMTPVVTLSAGEHEPDVDAGLVKLGTASLGDTVWYDTNRNGRQDTGETGARGVAVTLTGAGTDGVIGTGDDLTRTTTTDANGKYLFDGLDAGDYKVTFGKPAGYEFTTTDGGAADVDGGDSDADPTTGMTSIVTLSEGEHEPDVDAGLVVASEAPAALDDEGKVCATEAKNVDVLANDSDAEGPLGVTAVNGQGLAAGGSVTLASGAVVTLNADGTLNYNSVTGSYQVNGQTIAAGELLIGQQAQDSFSYSVTDSDGQTAMATVDMTVCGSKNTLETIANSLPEGGTVTLRIDHSYGGAFYTAELANTGDERFDGKSFDIAYCVAANEPIDTNVAVPYRFYLASEDAVPTGTIANPENLDMVNWILNQDFGSMDNGEGGTYTEAEIQGAIWGLTDDLVFVSDLFDYGTTENAQEIYDLALANGEGFEAGENDIVGLILDPTEEAEAQGNIQPFIIGVPFDDLAQDCLCG